MKERWMVFYYLGWLQALVATLGSLFFSEVMKFTPCILCWYQRIFMYPLVFIITVGMVAKDKNLSRYVLSLAIPGWLIALYHNFLSWGIVTETAEMCANGVSCTTRYTGWFGFITIPLMSLTAFSVIIVLMYLASRSRSRS